MKIKLRPFTVPNFVVEDTPPRQRQDGIFQARSHPLRDLEADELAAMCNEWRAAVFAKAGMNDPEVESV